MKLSTKSLYGLLALMDLAISGRGDSLQAKDIAERQQMPVKYLEQVLAQLRRGELIVSERGAQGGYQLAKPPRQITLQEVLAVMDDTGHFATEFNPRTDSVNEWVIHQTMEAIQQFLNEQLSRYNLMDLMSDKLRRERIPIYQI